MNILALVYFKTLLIQLESDTIPDSATEKHLSTVHEIKHDIL